MVDGALQPEGTVIVTAPLDVPPTAAVKSNSIELPVEPLATLPTDEDIEPDPSADNTVMVGDELRLVSVPPLLDCSCPCHIAAPGVDAAVAPGPPDAVLP